MPDLKQRRAWRSISDLFSCAASSVVVLKEKRMRKIQSRDKNEGMMFRAYRMWKNQEVGRTLGWSLGDLVCKM